MNERRVVAIIQARMGSTRLPGKVLREIAGETMLYHVVRRTHQAKLVNRVVVATTESSEDDPIIEECFKLQVPVFRGSTNDVLDRYYRAASKYQAHAVVRITSDCPLIDPETIDMVIRKYLDSDADYAALGIEGGFPRGMDIEIFNFTTLEKTHMEAKKDYEREHVTPYIYQHPELFKIHFLEAKGKLRMPAFRLTVDTEEDLRLMREIFKRLYNNRTVFSIEKVIDLLDEHPELLEINAHIHQKELGE